MQIEGLIPFKSYTDQAMTYLYFLRILINFYSFYSVKLVAMIIGWAISDPRNTCFRCLDNSLRIDPSKKFSTSCPFFSLLLNFSSLISFRLSIVFLISKLEFKYSKSLASIY